MTRITNRLYFLIITGSLIISCSNNKSVPFPSVDDEFPQPVAKSFKIPAGQNVEWKTLNPDSIVRKKEAFHLEDFPSKPFDLNGFHPLNQKPVTVALNLSEMADTAFKMVDLPMFTQTSKLGNPKKIKATIPRIKDGATEPVVLFGADPAFPMVNARLELQDSKGFLWFSSLNGLCRFDGEYYELFTQDQGLNNNGVNDVAEDNDGKIWVVTRLGIQMLDEKAGTITEVFISRDQTHIDASRLIIDRNGRLWASDFSNMLIVIDPAKNIIKKFESIQKVSSYSSVFQDSRLHFWLNTNDGLYRMDEEKGTLKKILYQTDSANKAINGLTEDKSGRLWVSSKNGIEIINEKQNSITHINPLSKESSTYSMVEDDFGKMWMGTQNGVQIIDTNLHRLKILNTRDGLSDNFSTSLYKDHHGLVWSGSDAINTRNAAFHLVNLDDSTVYIRYFAAIEDRSGRMWIGASNGLYILDKQLNRVKHLSGRYGLSNSRILSILEDSDGRIWVVNDNLHIIDLNNLTIEHIEFKQKPEHNFIYRIRHEKKGGIWITGVTSLTLVDKDLKSIKTLVNIPKPGFRFVKEIVEDNDGDNWIPTSSGLFMLQLNTGKIIHMDRNMGLSSNSITSLLNDAKGRIWAGTYGGGINIIDKKKGTILKLTMENGLPDNNVMWLMENSGKIYASTQRGVVIVTPPDNPDSIWRLISYGELQGLTFTYFPESVGLLTKNKEAWWPVLKGDLGRLLMFSEPNEDTTTRRTDITGIEILQQQYNFAEHDSLINLHNLSLPYDQNDITFNFTNANYINADKTRYRYVLAGNDKSWNAITKNSYADYNNLSPGDYTFSVASKGFNQRWSKPSDFHFTIRPPWWRTWWAYLLYALVFGLIVRAYINFRSRKLKRENESLEEKVNLRTNDLNRSLEDLKATQSQLVQSEKMASLGELTAGIAHEIQNPLNFVNNFSEVNLELVQELKEEKQKPDHDPEHEKTILNDIEANLEKISQHGKRADSIVKNMLQHSRTSSGQKESTDINALADEYLRLSYHGLRSKDKFFNAVLETDFDKSVGDLNVVSLDVGRVLLNLYNNAFYSVNEKKKLLIEGYQPTVSVTTEKLNGKVRIRVRDNGLGIPQKVLKKLYQPFFTTKPTGEGTGLGLSLSFDIIVKGHGGTINANTKEGEYAEFIIELPYG